MACENLGTCCGCCEGYTCSDCYFCRKSGCMPNSPNGACPGSPAEPCCYCAPRCFMVILAGIVVNSDRECFDCCYKLNPSNYTDQSQPCSSGDNCCPPCDPQHPPDYGDCFPKSTACCPGECKNNTSCGFFNGNHIIDNGGPPWGSCECYSGGWATLYPQLCEPKQIEPCCVEANEHWCDCVTGPCCCDPYPCCPDDLPGWPPCPGGGCCPPLCWTGFPGECPLYGGSKQDCLDAGGISGICDYGTPPCETCEPPGYSACGSKAFGPACAGGCQGPWCLHIGSCMYAYDDYTNWPIITSVVRWEATVTGGGFNGTFAKEWAEGIDWPLGESYYGGWIPCDVAINLIRTDSPPTDALCDWFTTQLALVPIGCPVVFWQQPQQLHYIKDNQKYVNLTEVKRRKLFQKTRNYIKNLKISNIDLKWENSSFKDEFNKIIQENVLKVILQNEDNTLDFSKKVYEASQLQIKQLFFESRYRPKNVRNKEEILKIYDVCQSCPYFSKPFSVCMLNNKSLKTTFDLDNFLTNADVECPDCPARWSKTTNLEPEPPRLERKIPVPPPLPSVKPKIL